MGPEVILIKLQELNVWLYDFTLFRVFLWLAGIYVVVLIIDLALLILLRDVKADMKKNILGTVERPSKGTLKEAKKRWVQIEAHLRSGNPSEWKVAILEADRLADQALSEMGYQGANLAERLAVFQSHDEEKEAKLAEAHAVTNRIVFEKDFSIERKEAERIIGLYREFLTVWEVI